MADTETVGETQGPVRTIRTEGEQYIHALSFLAWLLARAEASRKAAGIAPVVDTAETMRARLQGRASAFEAIAKHIEWELIRR